MGGKSRFERPQIYCDSEPFLALEPEFDTRVDSVDETMMLCRSEWPNFMFVTKLGDGRFSGFCSHRNTDPTVFKGLL